MASFALRTDLTHRVSPLWILIYLPLHQLVAQTVQYDKAFLCLRVTFLVLVVATLALQRENPQIYAVFIGRWLRCRRDWIAAATCLLLVLGTQQILSRWLHFRREDPSQYFWMAVAAPINEEVVFRGLFLAALLAYFPRWSFGAVLLTTAMFVGCHDLTYNAWPVSTTLTVQSLIYGVCYLWTGCVPLCILCHWLWNTLFFISWLTR